MSRVYVSHNNIISSLGFSSEEVVQAIHDGRSGVTKIDDKSLLKTPFFGSLIDSKLIGQHAENNSLSEEYTRLEQLMILSLKKVIDASKIALDDRVGVIISSTKGNIDALDANVPLSNHRAYLGTLSDRIQKHFGFTQEPIILSNACVSGLLALVIAKRYITAGLYDHVFVVGGDLVTSFILSGFNSFQAMSNDRCKPYDKNRTGINIGEAVATALVTNSDNDLTAEAVEIVGDGSRNDANHISGPSRTGEGLVRSIRSAMKEADMSVNDIDYISAHGTATVFNDEMEAVALNRLGLENIPVNSLKGYFGHTLGASGLIESIIGMHSLRNNTLYRSLGYNEQGTTSSIAVIEKVQPKQLTTFLKTASGFGGCNTAALFRKVKTNQ
ncbi:MAG: beta-ketoacyl synthase [Flavobacteriaceae bacterium]|nr:beta-ketoacyl synthase [Flavobacteriaceae bacterium]